MVPRPKLPWRKADPSDAKTKEAKATKTTAKKPAAKKAAAKAPAPNMAERMEGLQGWMAEIERKQGRMTYFGAAALGVAVLASAGALYLGITNQQNSADKDDFEALEQRVTEVGDSLKSSTEEQLKTLDARMQTVEQRLDGIDQKQKQLDTTISTLQTQVNQANAQGNNAGAGTVVTPGTTTTPDTKP